MSQSTTPEIEAEVKEFLLNNPRILGGLATLFLLLNAVGVTAAGGASSVAGP
jgi:hypothetical protein